MQFSLRLSAAALCAAGAVMSAQAAISFDADVTPDVIFGSGNANGSFTVDRAGGVELGLRGKLRHDATGQPQDIFNSNGDGTYSFATGVAPTQAFPTAVWSFEWSINTDYLAGVSDTDIRTLSALTYRLGLDTDTSQGTSFFEFDPINAIEPVAGSVCWDHSMGTNATGSNAGSEVAGCRSVDATVAANAAAAYATALGANNVAQNSWKAHWYIPGFDPTVDGTYDLFLAAFDDTGAQVARTQIQIIAGEGGAAAVPEPGSIALAGLALGGLAWMRRRRR